MRQRENLALMCGIAVEFLKRELFALLFSEEPQKVMKDCKAKTRLPVYPL